jgi:hypothetical protein
MIPDAVRDIAGIARSVPACVCGAPGVPRPEDRMLDAEEPVETNQAGLLASVLYRLLSLDRALAKIDGSFHEQDGLFSSLPLTHRPRIENMRGQEPSPESSSGVTRCEQILGYLGDFPMPAIGR